MAPKVISSKEYARKIGGSLIFTHKAGYRHLALVQVPKARRGMGIGSKIMAYVCKEADRDGVVLRLFVMPIGGGDRYRLAHWYMGFGFKFTAGWTMERKPACRTKKQKGGTMRHIITESYQCTYCKKVTTRRQSMILHERYCKKNPARAEKQVPARYGVVVEQTCLEI